MHDVLMNHKSRKSNSYEILENTECQARTADQLSTAGEEGRQDPDWIFEKSRLMGEESVSANIAEGNTHPPPLNF
jgi:hypothetical protein